MKTSLFSRISARFSAFFTRFFAPFARFCALFVPPKRPDPRFLALTGELRCARRDLNAAYGQFNQAASPEAVETCVYRIRAGEARCEYLWRAVKAWEQGSFSAVP